MKSFITYLTEKKDHIIKRLKNLTDDEKDQVIAFFNKKPNLENKIDWHNRELTFKNFQQVMDTTKTERKKAVKKHGITGLREGKDYLELKMYEYSIFSAYIPLHHEASRLIASKKIGGVDGKWCISGNDSFDWRSYIYRDELIPIMFVDYGEEEKFVLLLNGDNLSFDSFWDQKDKRLGLNGCMDHLGSDWKDEILSPNIALLKKARTIFDESRPDHWFEIAVKERKIKISDDDYEIDGFDRLLWKDGVWKDGTWKDGDWEGGTWERGQWEDGTWFDGIWEDGIWKDGVWFGGIWMGGTWMGGKWKDGTWEGGYDKNGNYHEEGDSPDKWNLK